jgi:hypothetical protein
LFSTFAETANFAAITWHKIAHLSLNLSIITAMIIARRRRIFTASMATVAAAAPPVPAVAAVRKKNAS